jgi:thiol-disulfide isomerase/thioredoxin
MSKPHLTALCHAAQNGGEIRKCGLPGMVCIEKQSILSLCCTIIFNMPILYLNDDDLRALSSEEENIMVMYYQRDCPICQGLTPVFEQMSRNSRYEEISFVMIDADENPTAKLFVGDKKLPLIAVYKEGVVNAADTVGTDVELQNFANMLLQQEI